MAPKDKLFAIEKGIDITKEGDNFFIYDGMALIGGPFQTFSTAKTEARKFKRMEFRKQFR